jgi:hypothetical protein
MAFRLGKYIHKSGGCISPHVSKQVDHFARARDKVVKTAFESAGNCSKQLIGQWDFMNQDQMY